MIPEFISILRPKRKGIIWGKTVEMTPKLSTLNLPAELKLVEKRIKKRKEKKNL